MHELRHKMTAKSRGGAEYLGKLLYLDPAFAMRGGVQYMQDIDPGVSGMDESEIIGHYAAIHAAATAVLTDLDGWNNARNTLDDPEATEEQKASAQNFIDSYEDAKIDRATAEKFAEESVAAGQEGALGQSATQAAMWDAIYKDSSDRRWGKFTGWMSNRLVANGFMGPEAQQALYEIKQRRNGAIDSELQLHQKMRSELERKYREDMLKYEDMKRQNKSDVSGSTAKSSSSTKISASTAPSIQMDTGIDSVSNALSAAKSAPPEQKTTLLASAIQEAVKLIPYLQATEANVRSQTHLPTEGAKSGKFAYPSQVEKTTEQVPSSPPLSSQQATTASKPMSQAEMEIQSQIRAAPLTASDVASIAELPEKYTGSPRNKDFLVG
jgi:hypothetical protein